MPAMTSTGEALALAAEHHHSGRLQAAERIYRQILAADESVAEAHYNLGNALKRRGELDEATSCYRRALELRPDLVPAHINLGNTLRSQGRLGEAANSLRRAIELNPGLADAHMNLGNVLQEQGQLDHAVGCYLQAIELEPERPDVHVNLGAAFRSLGQLDDAIACHRRALELLPTSADALVNLGAALHERLELDDAVVCYRRAIELTPDHAAAHNNLATALKDQGKIAEAIASYDRAIQLKPDFTAAQSNRLYALNFSPHHDAQAIYTEHCRWNDRFAEPLTRLAPPQRNDPTPDRRLRIGYVSPDLRDHVIGRFLLPLLECHDRTSFEIYCYSSVQRPDAITDRCREQADAWRHVLGLSDEQLAETVRHDGVDILVDLSMHMADNRLLAFARKPAPVQVSWLAYAGTTGLAAMDYRLTDPYLDPPQQSPAEPEPIYSERSVHLPETYWCYCAPAEAPPANPLPALAAGHVTFGCLNNFCKVSGDTLATWAELLRTVPNSRLLMHAHPGSHRDRVQEYLARQSISPERLRFVEMRPLVGYFRLYHEIDVALDPFPYGGGTTTCDALWMGVPVVTLAGRTAVGRGGLSILSNVGIADWVANDREQYIRIAADLASDLGRLSMLRGTLRQRMLASPLMDAPRFARNIEAAYRSMWHRWCAGQKS